jgi:hypothetical protein
MCPSLINFCFIFPSHAKKSVNLGGLFVIEPFIVPSLFQRYPGAVDEWSLSLLMAADTANGGLDQIEEHYKTFIVRNGCFSVIYPSKLTVFVFADGRGYCGDCWSWSELGQASYTLLGD